MNSCNTVIFLATTIICSLSTLNSHQNVFRRTTKNQKNLPQVWLSQVSGKLDEILFFPLRKSLVFWKTIIFKSFFSSSIYAMTPFFSSVISDCVRTERFKREFFQSTNRPIGLTQCCSQFRSLGAKALCVFYLHDNTALTFKWYGNTWNNSFYSQRIWIGYNIEWAE